ncbi:MAG: hypothetical protein AAFR99_18060 [Cyanobacteria bacterium J06629_9]
MLERQYLQGNMGFLLLAMGLGVIWVSIRLQEEVLLIAAAIAGLGLLVWGFVLTPSHWQVAMEVLVIVLLFPVCVRCTFGEMGLFKRRQ